MSRLFRLPRLPRLAGGKRKWAWLLGACLLLWVLLRHDHARSYSYRLLVNRFGDVAEGLRVPAERGPRLARFRPLLDHPDKCAGADVFLLLFVKSAPRHAERRRAIRATWGDEGAASRALGATVKVLFALGAPDCQAVQEALRAEDGRHGDLIQRDFADSFRNLTLKLLVQLQWARRRCPGARFLMLADDDVFVHTANLGAYLRGAPAAGELWAGHVIRGAPPVRRRDSKYYVPPEVYRWAVYPDYTAGMGYVLSGRAAEKMYRAGLTLDVSLYVDDAFAGVCGVAAGLWPRAQPYFSGGWRAPDHPCVYQRMLTSHGHVGDLPALWAAVQAERAGRPPGGPPLLDRLYCVAVRVFLLCARPTSAYSCLTAFL
ncbi:lactosylceramide 1,3-N-acetyl-beta-D-glucosaminyltransferase A-like [Stigmatopora nigra]